MQDNKELAENLRSSAFNARVVPSLAYTDPEVAWVGLTKDSALAPKALRYGGACSPGPHPDATLPMAATKVSPSCCLTIHSHPTLGESIGMAAEVAHVS